MRDGNLPGSWTIIESQPGVTIGYGAPTEEEKRKALMLRLLQSQQNMYAELQPQTAYQDLTHGRCKCGHDGATITAHRELGFTTCQFCGKPL